jgi:uncharacterized membrane protein
MTDQGHYTAEQRRQQEIADAPKRKVTLKNHHAKGQRYIYDHTGKHHVFGSGEEREVELTEAHATALEEASKKGGDLRVAGHDPEEHEQVRLAEAPEIPEEQKSRAALAEAEAQLMEEGQEADKERREKVAKMSGPALAAETGIHMHARGATPDVVARPPDAPPKKK